LLQAGRAAEAEALFRELLGRLEAGAAYEATYDRGCTLMRLGRCLTAQGRPAQAVGWHRRALEAFEGLSGSSDSAKGMLGKVYTDLGDNLAAVGQFDEAQQAYASGLEISKEVGDHRSVGIKLGQLGTLAMRRGDLGEAARRYGEALETFRTLGEPESTAGMLYQLGMIAQMLGEWEEAEGHYREALQYCEQSGDLPHLAMTCNQLATVAGDAGRPADAERWYLRALDAFEKLDAPVELAKVLNNLANLYIAQSNLDAATHYAQRALELKETLDSSAEPWSAYATLAEIAEARGRAAEAARWRRKEQESYAAYAGAAHQLPSWAPPFIAAVAAAVQGNAGARAEVERILPQLEATSDWRNLPPVILRILAGESDMDALCVGLDHIDAYIVRAIQAQLSGEAPQTSEVSKTSDVSAGPEEGQGVSLGDLLELVARATQPGAPPELGQQLHAATQQMSLDRDLPPELRALGGVLHRILSGERAPDLSGLPPELAEAVRGIL
jgi:tetratricopeptide (TPR) repeat protein